MSAAAAETLEVKWREAGIEVLKVMHTCDDELETGYMRWHTPHMYNSTKLTTFEIFWLLYVKDGAFHFSDWNT